MVKWVDQLGSNPTVLSSLGVKIKCWGVCKLNFSIHVTNQETKDDRYSIENGVHSLCYLNGNIQFDLLVTGERVAQLVMWVG